MWIRSQDKEVLRNVNDIEIIKFEGEKYTTILGDGCHLGVYSSREKALMVLDWIQNQIEYKNVEVHQMPQDEDVEA